jgi:phosphomannomutase
MAGIFKAYDIRGIYGDTLTDEIAYKIGRAFVTFVGCKKVVVGRDMRPHSEGIFAALAKGLTEQGADVVDLGVCSTPMSYFANGHLNAEASIIITASHNPGEWNGFKMCREQAIPLSGATGIMDIERIVNEEDYAEKPEQPGSITKHEIVDEYVAHIRQFADLQRPVKIAIDFANGMGIVENKVLEGLVEIEPLFDTLDGSFPNHDQGG